MRHKVIESRQEIFNHNEHEVSKRWAFEEGVREFLKNTLNSLKKIKLSEVSMFILMLIVF